MRHDSAVVGLEDEVKLVTVIWCLKCCKHIQINKMCQTQLPKQLFKMDIIVIKLLFKF